MAQSGFTPIQLYNSSTAGNKPTAGNLSTGELAINITDGNLFYKDNNSVVQTLAQSQATYGFKNRIINGAMMIDQRNAGASITANTNTYGVDRWKCDMGATGKGTVQQTPSTTETGYATRVAAGFTNYLAFTSSAATTVTSTDYYSLVQAVEGLNVADLAWGTANAKPVTLSFWAYSSLTGTFGGSIQNSAYNRSYPFSYSIPAANTWTQISVTIPGDTTGTWLTTNGVGLRVRFGLGSGSTYSGTAGAWTSGDIETVTGAVQVVATNGATFYITGVQLEKGSTATSFDYRPYGTELALCQRYYEKSYDVGTAPGTIGGSGARTASNSTAFTNSAPTRNFVFNGAFVVTKRTTPTTITLYDPSASNASGKISGYSSGTQYTVSSISGSNATLLGYYIVTSTSPSTSEMSSFHFTADAEL